VTLVTSVIGCGAVFEQLHAPVLDRLQQRGEIAIRYLVDPDGARASRFLGRFPGSVWKASIDDCIRDHRFDVALVSSPVAFHVDHVEKALRAGSHVLAEKPLTAAGADARRLAKASASTSRVLAVGQTRRFTRSLATAADLCRQGELGSPVSFDCFEGGAWRWPIASLAPFLRAVAGGGVLTDKGVHVLDSLFWIFGPLTVSSYSDDALIGGVENNCRLEVQGESVSGRVHLSWDQSLNNEIHARGPLGELRVLPSNNDAVAFRKRGGEWTWIPNTRTWPSEGIAANPARMIPQDYEDSIYLEWIDFLRSVRHGGDPAVDATAAASVIEQIERAYAMATPIPEPALTPSERTRSASMHWKKEGR
jgi:predicted dehydrogenase